MAANLGEAETMKDLFSISEMSQISSISKATLRFYDSIGLFKPSKN